MMGLYLCVFDLGHDEQEGVETGLYEDFCEFVDAVVKHVENGKQGSNCPTLTLYSACDGEWSDGAIDALEEELKRIQRVFTSLPPEESESPWKREVIRKAGLKLRNLDDCFFDIDGENLVNRLLQLCATARRTGQPILFQ